MVELTLNGKPVRLAVPAEMPLLWALREQAGLTGTKFGCGIGACGACTVHIDGVAVRACVVPTGGVAGRAVTTIEGLSRSGRPHPVQAAWIEQQVPQCGYCQSGMIMAVAALLDSNPAPTDTDIDAAITNICRCGTYERIRSAIHAAAEHVRETVG
jgi:isoquinoline 1-oxidoreductase subunit alpha